MKSEFYQCTSTEIFEHGSDMGLDIYQNAEAFLSGTRDTFRADLQTTNPKHKVAEIVLSDAMSRSGFTSNQPPQTQPSKWGKHNYLYTHTVLAEHNGRQIIETTGIDVIEDTKTGGEIVIISDHVQYAGSIAISSADQA